jgi:hypothetical protein
MCRLTRMVRVLGVLPYHHISVLQQAVELDDHSQYMRTSRLGQRVTYHSTHIPHSSSSYHSSAKTSFCTSISSKVRMTLDGGLRTDGDLGILDGLSTKVTARGLEG